MAFTKQGFPSAFATEGDPTAGGFPGDFDKYIHTVKDTMDVDDETGHFSLDVSCIPFPLGTSVDMIVAHGKILRTGDCICCGTGGMGQCTAVVNPSQQQHQEFCTDLEDIPVFFLMARGFTMSCLGNV